MKLLRDKQIVELLESENPLIENFIKPDEWFSKDSLVQPSSLDLHIGDIFVPDSKKPIIASEKYNLPPGSTAVVETKEILNLPTNISAFGFPPNSISADGILMTNPGHIDPGYKGKMSFTLINMSKINFELRKGELIVTLLIVELSENCEKDYSKRREIAKDKVVKPSTESVNESIRLPKQLDLLTYDFMNVERRAKKIANKRVGLISVIATIIVALVPLSYNVFSGLNTKVNKLDNRLEIIEKQQSLDSLKQSVNEIKEVVDSLQVNL